MASGEKWTDEELELAVNAYFKMRKYQQNQTKFNKSEMKRELQKDLHRSIGSIDMRFQNISFVMESHGLSFVKGFVPLSGVGPTDKEKIWQLIQKHLSI